MAESMVEETAIIPKEISSFFSREGGHSLIIKGETGSGKTTIALEIMKRDYGIERTEFISIRMGEEKLFKQYPWLKKRMKKDKIVENARKLLNSFYSDEIVDSVSVDEVKKTQSFLSKRLLNSIYEEEERAKEVHREELQKLEGKVERGEIITEEDKLDDRLKNEFVFEIGKTLPELDKAYDMVDRNLPERSLIIIDSIEALSEHYGIPKDKIVRTVQKDLVEKSNTDVIFIQEKLDDMDLDDYVDGVVSLKEKKLRDRRIRVLDILKLRSQTIKNHTYLYTLTKGRFKTIPKTSMLEPEGENIESSAGSPDSDSMNLEKDLNELIKEFEPETSLLVEIDKNSPRHYIDNLIFSLVTSSCKTGRATIVLPPLELRPDYITTMVETHLKESALKNLLLLETEKDSDADKVKFLKGDDINQDLNKELLEHSLPQASDHLTIFLDLETIELVYGPESFDNLRRMISSFKKRGHSVVLIGSDYIDDLDKLKFLSETVIKIEEIENTTCIFCEKPSSPMYSVSPSSKDISELSLIPLR